MSAVTFLAPVLASLQQTIPMVIREARPSGDYLECIVSWHDVARCCELLSGTFGEAAKDFNKPAQLDPKIRQALGTIGGIRIEQCLFLAQPEPGRAVYATLWPWASNPAQATLKVGILEFA